MAVARRLSSLAVGARWGRSTLLRWTATQIPSQSSSPAVGVDIEPRSLYVDNVLPWEAQASRTLLQAFNEGRLLQLGDMPAEFSQFVRPSAEIVPAAMRIQHLFAAGIKLEVLFSSFQSAIRCALVWQNTPA
jgi:hypothetical protein